MLKSKEQKIVRDFLEKQEYGALVGYIEKRTSLKEKHDVLEYIVSHSDAEGWRRGLQRGVDIDHTKHEKYIKVGKAVEDMIYEIAQPREEDD